MGGIRDAIARGIPRSEIFLTTKLFPRFFGKEAAKIAVKRFLEELGVEYIDLVLLHMPNHPLAGPMGECSGKTPLSCREETWQSLSSIRKEGLVRDIGVSNFNVRQIKEPQALQAAPVAANQIQYNPWAPDWQLDTVTYCHSQRIVVTAYASLGMFMEKAKM